MNQILLQHIVREHITVHVDKGLTDNIERTQMSVWVPPEMEFERIFLEKTGEELKESGVISPDIFKEIVLEIFLLNKYFNHHLNALRNLMVCGAPIDYKIFAHA